VTIDGQTVFNKGTSNKYISQTLAAPGAVTMDASLGDIQSISLQANATSSSISNGVIGQMLIVQIIQDATGSRTFSWPASVKFINNTAPTLTTTANKRDNFTFYYNGSTWFESARSLNLG
jgi:hypothetical protein